MRGAREGPRAWGPAAPAYPPEIAMPRGAAHIPGSLRARSWGRGQWRPGSGWRDSGLRAGPVAALALPPARQPGLATRACPQSPPRLRDSARGTCTRGRWGGEVRTPRRPRVSSPHGPLLRGSEEAGASRHVRPTPRETSPDLPPKGSPRWRGCGEGAEGESVGCQASGRQGGCVCVSTSCPSHLRIPWGFVPKPLLPQQERGGDRKGNRRRAGHLALGA